MSARWWAQLYADQAAMQIEIKQQAPLSVATWLRLEAQRKRLESMFVPARPSVRPEEER